jgi:hypothetical protein
MNLMRSFATSNGAIGLLYAVVERPSSRGRSTSINCSY